jgi:glycosyltransferase involved in cell wall biosynthesis
MACATPVIAANAGSLPDVVGDAGILVDPRDTDAICHALQRVVEDTALRAELAERGLRRSAAFRWSAVAAQTTRVYAEAVECGS